MRVAEAYEVLKTLKTRAIFDQFGEEGLKNGLPQMGGGWTEGFTFHGDAKRVFRDFFGTDNPFADFQVKLKLLIFILGNILNFSPKIQYSLRFFTGTITDPKKVLPVTEFCVESYRVD